MDAQPDLPDPSLYIERLGNEDAFYREAAAWSLGEIGSPRAVGPLSALLLREMSSVERGGYLAHADVVRACVEALRRIGAPQGLFALGKSLCVLTRSKGVDEETVVEIADTLDEIGGPSAVREAADRVVRCAKEGAACPGLHLVGGVLLDRLGLCGDAAVSTLRRLSRAGPEPLRRLAQNALASAVGHES